MVAIPTAIPVVPFTSRLGYLEGRTVLNCSEELSAEIVREVMSVLKASYEEALKLIGDNMDLMDKLAGHLIEKETITGKEFMEIFRREKGLPDPTEEKAKEGEAEAVVESEDNNATESEAVVESEDNNAAESENSAAEAPAAENVAETEENV